MLKIAVFSDIHIHNYQPFDKEGSRLNNTLDCLFYICKQSYDRDILTILFAGDLWDNPYSMNRRVWRKTKNTFKRIFKEFPQLTIITISGNHDQFNTDGDSNYQTLHELFPRNFKILTGKEVIGIHGVKIVGVPYTKSWTPITPPSSTNTILLIHQTPDECHPMIEGDFSATDKCWEKFHHVFCGHIHKHQRLTDNFTVVGSPLHRDSGDIGQEKGFLIYTPETNEIERVILDFPQFKRSSHVEDDYHYWLVEKELETTTKTTIGNFTTTTSKEEILKSYIEETGGKVKELLPIGLELLKKIQ